MASHENKKYIPTNYHHHLFHSPFSRVCSARQQLGARTWCILSLLHVINPPPNHGWTDLPPCTVLWAFASNVQVLLVFFCVCPGFRTHRSLCSRQVAAADTTETCFPQTNLLPTSLPCLPPVFGLIAFTNLPLQRKSSISGHSKPEKSRKQKLPLLLFHKVDRFSFYSCKCLRTDNSRLP